MTFTKTLPANAKDLATFRRSLVYATSTMGAQYTLNKRKEWLSRAYITAVATAAGYRAEIVVDDLDGEDAQVRDGGVQVDFQLKATAFPQLAADHLSFDLDVRTYNKLCDPIRSAPGYLLLLILPKQPADWLNHSEKQLGIRRCAYWRDLTGLPASSNMARQRVHIPLANVMDVKRLQTIMRAARERL